MTDFYCIITTVDFLHFGGAIFEMGSNQRHSWGGMRAEKRSYPEYG